MDLQQKSDLARERDQNAENDGSQSFVILDEFCI